jgi:hypothetical protein
LKTKNFKLRKEREALSSQMVDGSVQIVKTIISKVEKNVSDAKKQDLRKI